MKYTVVRTDTADEQIRKIILYINENFGSEVVLRKLDELEESILHLGDHPDIGIIPLNCNPRFHTCYPGSV